MNIKPKNKIRNHLTLTEAFNRIERKTSDKIDPNLDSFIKDADSTLDNIYVYNTLFNPIFTLKYLNNRKLTKALTNKKKIKKFYSYKSLKKFNNTKKSNLKINERNETFFKFNSYAPLKNGNKTKNISKKINNNKNDNGNEKHVKFNFNTVNNFNDESESNKISQKIILDGLKNNSNKQYNEIMNNINDINRDNNKEKSKTIQINKNDSPKISSKEYGNILRELYKNKVNLLKFQKKKFIKEMKKERKMKKIDEAIKSKENSLFQNNLENKFKNYGKFLNNNLTNYYFNAMKIDDNYKNNFSKFNETEKNLSSIKKAHNKAKPMISNSTLNIKIKNKIGQIPLGEIKNKSEKNIKKIEKNNNNSNEIDNSNNINFNDNENESVIKNNEKKENNLNALTSEKKLSINNSSKNIKKLEQIYYNIYLNCIKNIKQNQNFPDILKYVSKKRLSQYKLKNLKNKIKSEEEILYPNKQLLKNQDKEINFHKKELLKRTEKENLYNNFKKQISERFIHKNLTIDAISKVSTKLAFYGRKYFIKNYNYDFIGDRDFLFKDEIMLNSGMKQHKKRRYYKVKNSCQKVIDDIDKLAKNKIKIIKRLNDDEEKYKNKKNGYFFDFENNDKNIDKDLIKKRLNLSRNENGKNYSNNFSYDEFANKSCKKEFLLPKVAFIKHGMSFDEF